MIILKVVNILRKLKYRLSRTNLDKLYLVYIRVQTWGQLLANVIDYITITLQFSWLHYITITSIFKCNRLHYNYFVNVIDYITDYIFDVMTTNVYSSLLCYFFLFQISVSLYACWYMYSNIYNWCFDIFLFHCLDICS